MKKIRYIGTAICAIGIIAILLMGLLNPDSKENNKADNGKAELLSSCQS